MRRLLLFALCGLALASGLSAVIALAGDNDDANPATGSSVVRDGHHQVFMARVPQGQDHIQVVPLDGPAMPDAPPPPDTPTPGASTPSAPSANAPQFLPPVEPTELTGPEVEPVAEPNRGPFATPAKPMRPAVEPAVSRRTESEVPASPPPNPDPPVSLGLPAMDRRVETARQPAPPIVTSQPPAPLPFEESPPRPAEDSPRILLRRARELYSENKLKEAEALGRHVSAMLVKWRPDEDTPAKLLSDIQIARQAAMQANTPAQPRFPVIAGIAARLNPRTDTAATATLAQSTPPAPPVPPAPSTAAPARSAVRQVSAVETPPLLPVPAETVPGSAFATQPALALPVVTPPTWQTAAPPSQPSAPSSPLPPLPVAAPLAPPPPTQATSHPTEAPLIDSDEQWQGHSTFIAANVGFGFVRPYIKNDPAFFVSTAGNPAVARQVEFDPGTQFLPEVSLSIVGPDDWGFRTSWWGFSTSETEGQTGNGRTVTAAPLGLGFVSMSPADVFTAFTKLGMDVADFEVTRDFHGANWAVEVAGGFRYAHIAQRYDVADLTGGATSLLFSGQDFNGFGPTLFARGRWQVAETGFYVFGDGRGSLLYGKSQQDAWLDLPIGIVNAATSSRMVMPVAEMELGVGYRRAWRGTDLFFEMGLDYQTWFEAGSGSRSTVEPNPPFVMPGATSSTADYNLGLMALTLRLGMNY